MIVLLLLATLAADAAIQVEGRAVPGEEVVVRVLDADGRGRPGETVRVVHRPGLQGQRELAIGITDSRGQVRWTPELWGVARIRAGDELQPVRIAPLEPPRGAIALVVALIVAGLLGSGYGLVPPRPPRRRRSQV